MKEDQGTTSTEGLIKAPPIATSPTLGSKPSQWEALDEAERRTWILEVWEEVESLMEAPPGYVDPEFWDLVPAHLRLERQMRLLAEFDRE